MMSSTIRAARLILVAIVVAGCGGTATTAPVPDPLAGRYSLRGGGSAIDAATALTTAFTKEHPAVTITIEDVGSDAGVALTVAGTTDLGMVSRDLKPSERGTVGVLSIGVGGTALAVNSKNPLTGLRKEQVAAIYAGAITSWAEVGGTPGPITVLVRESSSSTRSVFESFFFGGKPTYRKDIIEVFEVEETVRSIQSFENAIGMVTVETRTLTDPAIRLLAIDGVAPTRASLQDGTYRVRRPLALVYATTGVKPAIQAFLDFVRGPEGQRIVAAY